MKIDFFELIKESFNFTWKYKVLWAFGFIIAFFAGGSGNSNSDSTSTNTANFSNNALGNDMARFVESPAFIIVVLLGILLLIGFILLSIYLTSISQTAIIRAVKHDNENQPERIKFTSLWSESNRLFFWKIAKFMVLWFLIIMGLFLLIVVPVILLTAVIGPAAIILFCCIFIFLIPVFIILGIIQSVAYNLIAYYEYGVRQAISEAWNLIKKEPMNFFLAILFNLLAAIPYVLVIVILSLMVYLPLTFVLTSLFASGTSIVAVTLIALGLGIIATLISAVVAAPFLVFFSVYWTKFINKLMGTIN